MHKYTQARHTSYLVYLENISGLCYNKSMTKAQKKAILIRSAARSIEAEGFNFEAVKKIIEQKILTRR